MIDVRMVCIEHSKIVVGRDAWFSIKGELGRAIEDVVHLDKHLALLTKCNDGLERYCQEMTPNNKKT